ncbi:hypothetical protein RhiirA4_477520 [Rhizophagus irregularis]|uniref:Uncharacterized protein n=1 Tax=Rhizophagus irregularis TaxID=588596 RepID=A0A2I1HDE6_9GLOM|nr:hypothetical protein RhiirA4_477520 [Rhizophagus irregularis]
MSYDFIIVNKRVKFDSKEAFVEFIDKYQNSLRNPVIILDMKELLDTLPTPSKLEKPEEWYFNNCNKAICLNYRLPSASSTIPVILHCSIFGIFKDHCEKDLERTNNLLLKYFDCRVEPIMLDRNRSTDGTVSTNDLYHKINIEYKNELCSTKSCAHLENCGYYLFIFCISKPTFTVYGAVLSNTAIVDPLTLTYHLIWLKNNEKIMLLLFRAFRTLRLSFQELDKYYRNVP